MGKNNGSAKAKREKYVNKIIDEFTQNGWELKKVFGRASANKFITSEKNYEELKTKVRKTRSYYKEREKIKEEVKQYDLKREQNKKVKENKKFKEELKKEKQRKKDIYQKSKLLEYYGNENGTANLIWMNRNILDLKDNDFESIENIQEKILEKFKNDLTGEICFFDKGEEKTVGAFYKNVKDDRMVKEMLTTLWEKVKNDKNAMHNAYKVLDYLYRDVLIQMYEGANASYSKFKKADNIFWRDVSDKMIKHYDNLIR